MTPFTRIYNTKRGVNELQDKLSNTSQEKKHNYISLRKWWDFNTKDSLTHLHQDTSRSDAIAPADVLVLMVVMTFLFFYVLHLAMEYAA